MPIKSYRPLTPVQRYKQTNDFAEVTTDTPYKALTTGKKKISGRNNRGVITIRRRGGGHTQHWSDVLACAQDPVAVRRRDGGIHVRRRIRVVPHRRVNDARESAHG